MTLDAYYTSNHTFTVMDGYQYSQPEFSTPNHFSTVANASAMSQNGTRFLPDYVRTISNIIYPTMLGIGVVGNIMVIVVILKMQHMRYSTNIFLANLAIADLLVLLIWGAITLVDTNSEQGILAYDKNMCNALIFMMEAVPSVSVLTMLAISFERYYAICQPLKAEYICTKSRAYRLCLLTWPLAVIFCSPHLFIKYRRERYDDGTYVETVCADETKSSWTKAYYIAGVSLFYFLPLITLTVLYSVIARHLKVAVAPNLNAAALRHRRRSVTMLATVVMAFFTCHLPIRIFYLLYVFASTKLVMSMGIEGYNNMWFIALVMLYLHSLVNPILYNLMSKRFRLGFKNICCDIKWPKKISCCRKNTNTRTPETSI